MLSYLKTTNGLSSEQNSHYWEKPFPVQIFSIPQSFLAPWGFAYQSGLGLSVLMLPYWFLALMCGSLTMIVQLRWPLQFTLRSLFIATTFLAVMLGMIAWLDRAWIGK
jgi:hypothetical protein